MIVPDRLYRLDTLQKLTGIGKAGFRELRSKGLLVRYVGRRGWVLGEDFIAAILRQGKTVRTEADELSECST